MSMSKSSTNTKTKAVTTKPRGKPTAHPKKGRGSAPSLKVPTVSRLRARSPGRSDNADAFLPDSSGGPARVGDDLAQVLAETFVEAATRGNEVFEDELGRPLPDEVGGPFVVTDANEELADVDAGNPPRR
jgi:hypothetical protein